VSDKKKMGAFAIPLWQKIVSWLSATVIIWLNVKLVYKFLVEWILASEHQLLISFTIVPLCLFCLLMLLYITFAPMLSTYDWRHQEFHGSVPELKIETLENYCKIAISVDFSKSDNKAISKAIQLGGKEVHYVLIHVLESTNAVVYGEDAFDMEREQDYHLLLKYANQIKVMGYDCDVALGFGNPKSSIPYLVTKYGCDMLVMGTHGHRTVKDILLGTTIEQVRHQISVPLVLV
jgi:manganese transport protein